MSTIDKLPKSTTSKRIAMLMRWWGYRPATVEEVKKIIEIQNEQDKYVPWLCWQNDKWSIVNKDLGWRNSQKFFHKE